MNTRVSFTLVCMLSLSSLLTTGSDDKNETLGEPDSKETGILPLSTAFVGTYSQNDPPTSFEWEGQVYNSDAVLDVLMNVILDPQSGAWQSQRALKLLEVLEHQLQGRECIEQLLTLYSQLSDRSHKAAVLACLSASEDPRALATFSEVLESEEDKAMRLFAASGLARWNIRAGVEELLGLLECNVHLPGRRNRIVKSEASFMLIGLNSAKGWGLPRREVGKPNGEHHKARRFTLSTNNECREWFEANKERFPAWKPGHPLPQVPSSEKGEPGNE